MGLKEQIDYWFDLAGEDIIVAESNYRNKHYLWCLFICHLSLEKALKGLYVQELVEIPPKVHDLVKIAKSININISEDYLRFFNEMNRFNIEARYPEYKNKMQLIADEEFTLHKLTKTKEVLQWLKSLMK